MAFMRTVTRHRRAALLIGVCLAVGAALWVSSCRGPESGSAYPPDFHSRLAFTWGGVLAVMTEGPVERTTTYTIETRGTHNHWFPDAICTDAGLLAYGVRRDSGNEEWAIVVGSFRERRNYASHLGEAQSFAFNKNGDLLAVVARDTPESGLFVWAWKDNEFRKVAPVPGGVMYWGLSVPISWTSDNRLVVGMKGDQIVSLSADGTDSRVLASGRVPTLSPDEKWLAYLRDGQAWLRNLSSGQDTSLGVVDEFYTQEVLWTSDSRFVVYAGKQRPSCAYPLYGVRLANMEQFLLCDLPWPKQVMLVDPKTVALLESVCVKEEHHGPVWVGP